MTNKVIYVKPDTKEQLDTMCPKNVTYDEFVKKLLELKEKVKTQ